MGNNYTSGKANNGQFYKERLITIFDHDNNMILKRREIEKENSKEAMISKHSNITSFVYKDSNFKVKFSLIKSVSSLITSIYDSQININRIENSIFTYEIKEKKNKKKFSLYKPIPHDNINSFLLLQEEEKMIHNICKTYRETRSKRKFTPIKIKINIPEILANQNLNIPISNINNKIYNLELIRSRSNNSINNYKKEIQKLEDDLNNITAIQINKDEEEDTNDNSQTLIDFIDYVSNIFNNHPSQNKIFYKKNNTGYFSTNKKKTLPLNKYK